MKEGLDFWILEFFPHLFSYIPLLAFLAPIIGGGELGVIAISILFSQNIKNIVLVLVFSFIGMLVSDSLWFFVAKSKFFNKFRKWKKISTPYKKLEKNIEKFSRGNDVLVILFAKLMVGTRILLMIYLGNRKISWGKFLIYDLIPTFLWAGLLVVVGVLVAKGFEMVVEIFKNFQLGITFLIIVFFLVSVFGKWLNKKLLKLTKQ